MKQIIDEVVSLAQTLIRTASVSPFDGELLEFIGSKLKKIGFQVENINIGHVKNMYAKIGKGPYFCFAGHIDVVPPGAGWKHSDPYSGIIEDGYLYGRGTSDMKVTVACALVVFEEALKKDPNLSLAFLLTSDEEAEAQDGLKKIVPKLQKRNEPIAMFLLGEPASDKSAADVIKIGRRGSITAKATVFGKQGHIAYPHLAWNPIPVGIAIAKELHELNFNDGDEIFGKSKLQLTNMNSFNETMNLIPGKIELRFGIRFNLRQSAESIKPKIEQIFAKHAKYSYEIDWLFHGNAFICKDSNLLSWVSKNVQAVTKIEPRLDAKGATSDGRFLQELAPVVEIGFQEDMAHKVDEKVSISDIETIFDVYSKLVQNLDFLKEK